MDGMVVGRGDERTLRKHDQAQLCPHKYHMDCPGFEPGGTR
jgi:hypothetical protein